MVPKIGIFDIVYFMANKWALLLNKMLEIVWELVLIQWQISNRLLMWTVSRRRLH
jgi:hypothetical protein